VPVPDPVAVPVPVLDPFDAPESPKIARNSGFLFKEGREKILQLEWKDINKWQNRISFMLNDFIIKRPIITLVIRINPRCKDFFESLSESKYFVALLFS